MKKSVFQTVGRRVLAAAMCLLMTFTALPSFYTVQASDYLFYDSFETSFTDLPDGWTAFAGANSDNVKKDTSHFTDGNSSVRLTSGSGSMGILSKTSSAEPGKEYKATVDAYVHSGAGTVYLLMYDANGKVVGSQSAVNAAAGQWKGMTVSAVAPAETSSAALLLYICEGAAGDVSYDNAVIYPGAELTVSGALNGNLAYGRKVETDFIYYNGLTGPVRATDGELSTSFLANSTAKQTKAYATVDLGAIGNINQVIVYEDGFKISQFDIAVSKDNISWNIVKGESTAGAKKIVNFPLTEARYVKIDVLEAEIGFGFRQIEVFNTSETVTFPYGEPPALAGGDLKTPEIASEIPYTKENFHIYLCLGQSNMVGADEVLAEDRVRTEGAYLFNSAGQWEYAQPGLGQMQGYNRYTTVSIDNTDPTAEIAGMSPAHSFTRTIAANVPDSIGVGIVCQSVGGTSIDQWQKGSGTQLYERAVARAQAAIASGGTLKGILWAQGEACASRDDYLTLLNKIAEGMRSELGVAAEEVPFIAASYPLQRAAQNENIAKIATVVENSDFISSKGTVIFDTVHFTADSQRLRGVRFAEKILSKVYGIQKSERELYQMIYHEDIGEEEVDVPVTPEAFTKGSGTAGDPYEVSTIGQLYNVKNFSSAHFKQTKDIEEPFSEPIPTFSGTYDGQEYSINLKIDTNVSTGFVTQLQAGGVLKNIVTKGTVCSSATAGGVGALAGSTSGQVNILNCVNYAAVSEGSRMGGLVGILNASATMTGCKNYGSVTNSVAGRGMYVGGLIGYGNSNLVTACANFGTVSSGDQVGGIIGQLNINSGMLSACYNMGAVEATGTSGNAGGIAGMLRNGVLSQCYNLGTVTGATSAGISVFYATATVARTYIEYSYNLDSAPFYVSSNTSLTAKDSYQFQTGSLTQQTGVTLLDLNGMRNLTAAQLGDSSGAVWNTETSFPTLIANPQTEAYDLWNVTFVKDGNGTISFTEPMEVKGGTILNIQITPDAGQIIESIKINGIPAENVSAGEQLFRTPAIMADTEILVTFRGPALSLTVDNNEGIRRIYFAGDAEAYSLYVYTGSERPSAPVATDVKSGHDISPYLTEAVQYKAVIAAVEGGKEINYSAPADVDARFFYGEGTQSDPFRIKNIGHLNNVRELPDKYFEQIADIEDEFTTPISVFSGTYDGKGHSINLGIDTNTSAGLIATAQAGCVLKNIVTKGSVKSTADTGALIGTTVNREAVTISDCVNHAEISGTSNAIGGLVGRLNAATTMTKCKNYGNVTGGTYVGGLVGVNASTLMTACANFGTVSASDQVGGLIGQHSSTGKVTASYNAGTVQASGSSGKAGGIAGMIRNGAISQCYNLGSVTGTNAMGISGYFDSRAQASISYIEYSYNLDSTPLYITIQDDLVARDSYQLSSETLPSAGGVTYLGLNAMKALTAVQLGDSTGTVWNTETFFPTLKENPQEEPFNMWEITVNHNSGGTVDLSGTAYVREGAVKEVTITPDTGYEIESIYYGDVPVCFGSGEVVVYATPAITESKVVTVNFAPSAAEPNIKMTPFVYTGADNDDAPIGVTFSAAREQIGSYTRTEFGMLLAVDANSLKDENLHLGNYWTAKGIAAPRYDGLFGIKFRGDAIQAGIAYYARPYAIYQSVDITKVVYGDIIEFVPQGK